MRPAMASQFVLIADALRAANMLNDIWAQVRRDTLASVTALHRRYAHPQSL